MGQASCLSIRDNDRQDACPYLARTIHDAVELRDHIYETEH